MTKSNPNARPYPKNRAPRVDRSKMTPEEWAEHKRRKDSEKCARWNARNPGKSYAALRHRRSDKPWWGPLLGAGDRARKNGLEFNLTHEWARQTYTGFCALTGLPFVVKSAEERLNGKSGGMAFSPSIDRIDPLKGYTQDNCRWVLHSVNNFKGGMSDVEMITIARALIARHGLPNSQ